MFQAPPPFRRPKLEDNFSCPLNVRPNKIQLQLPWTHPAFGMLYLYEKSSVLEIKNAHKQNVVNTFFPYKYVYTNFQTWNEHLVVKGTPFVDFLKMVCYFLHVKKLFSVISNIINCPEQQKPMG